MNLCGLGVMTFFELLDFFAVTTPAVIGRNDHGNALPVVLEGCRIFFAGAMARVAVNILRGVGAFPPLLHYGVLLLWQSRQAWPSADT